MFSPTLYLKIPAKGVSVMASLVFIDEDYTQCQGLVRLRSGVISVTKGGGILEPKRKRARTASPSPDAA